MAIDTDMFTYNGQSVGSEGWRRETDSPFHDVIDSALRALSNGVKLASNSPTSAEIQSIYRSNRTRESSEKQHRVIMRVSPSFECCQYFERVVSLSADADFLALQDGLISFVGTLRITSENIEKHRKIGGQIRDVFSCDRNQTN